MANDFVKDSLESAHKALDHANRFEKSIPGPHPMPTYAIPHNTRVESGQATRSPKPMSTGEDAAAGIHAKQKNVGDYVKAVSEE